MHDRLLNAQKPDSEQRPHLYQSFTFSALTSPVTRQKGRQSDIDEEHDKSVVLFLINTMTLPKRPKLLPRSVFK